MTAVPDRVSRRAVDGLDLRGLVERAKLSDGDAWEVLYRRAYPGLMAFASRRIDAEHARDAVAETMARAVARIDRFEWRDGGFDGWLFGILRHVIADEYRARARAGRRGGELAEVPVDEPLDHVLHNEEAGVLRAAFMTLDARDREVLELRVIAGLSCEEAAAALGKRPGALRMAQSRAIARLRDRLEELT
jgi:RNA polymerase sigma-70 factor (ECF subfamily)